MEGESMCLVCPVFLNKSVVRDPVLNYLLYLYGRNTKHLIFTEALATLTYNYSIKCSQSLL